MPRRGSSQGATSAFRQVQRQARSLLVNLHKEIRAKEAELKRLKDEEASLGQLTGSAASARASDGAGARGGGGRGRINWREVLSQLPKQFNAGHIRAVRGLKAKRPSEIFAAITRWIEAGMVKRKSRGLYERA
jgi:hypothetical protein